MFCLRFTSRVTIYHIMSMSCPSLCILFVSKNVLGSSSLTALSVTTLHDTAENDGENFQSSKSLQSRIQCRVGTTSKSLSPLFVALASDRYYLLCMYIVSTFLDAFCSIDNDYQCRCNLRQSSNKNDLRPVRKGQGLSAI